MAQEWLTTEQAADLSGYHPDHVRCLLKAGDIQGRKWGQAWQVNRVSLLEYINDMKTKGEKR